MLDKRERNGGGREGREEGRERGREGRFLYTVPKLRVVETCVVLPLESVVGPAYWLPLLRKLWMLSQSGNGVQERQRC